MRPVLPLLLIGLAATAASAAVPPAFDDATLRAVQFVDRNEGWAVGDLGVIWHTIDGGKTWERQPSGTRASLRGVKFLTPYIGWVVGRVELPNAAGSAGVVLFTADGGVSWKELSSTTLPGLNAVQFFDENRGVVAGDGTDAFPTGMFRTEDGGRTWTVIPGWSGASWRGVDFLSPDAGILCGSHQLAIVKGSRLTRLASMAKIPADAAAVLRSGDRVLVGTGGGVRWLMLDGSDPGGDAFAPIAHYDVRSLCRAGEAVWAAGSPGSVVYRSRDNGKSWEAVKTGHAAPLHGIQMLDAATGWAVGELGTILGTTDGGKSWALLKSGGHKAAVLFTHARPEGVPLGAIAALGGKEGYLCAAVCLSQTDEPRLAAAVRAVGGVGGACDGFVRWPGYMTEASPGGSPDRLPTSRDQVLLARLVLALRTWRPEVVVTDLLSPDASPADQFTLLHMKEAFTLAADPSAFPEQIGQLGLGPHAARKLYAIAPDAKDAIALDLTEFVPEFGEALKDTVELGAAVIDAPVPDTVRFRLIAHRLPDAEQHGSLMEGVPLAEGGTARRKRPSLSPEAAPLVAELQKAADLRRKLEAIAAEPKPTDGSRGQLTRLLTSLQQLPPDLAARAGVSLGQHLAETGRWSAAREVFALVAEKYPLNTASVEALRWLVRYHASGEARRRIELGHFPVYQGAAFGPPEESAVRQVMYADPVTVRPTVRFATPAALQQWHRTGLDLEPKLAAFGAGYALDPGTNFCLLAARRNLGLYRDAARQLQLLLPSGEPTDGWWARLADELRLVASTTEGPKHTPAAECRSASARPHLDGKLDDECWKRAGIVTLKAVDRYSTEARLVHDDQFLYVGLTCSHPEGKQVPKAEKRARDADLRGHDRVELFLDLDRDYSTYYRLRVDHRGCVAEDCWGDPTWDPRWFVAVEPTPAGWTAELAIPLAELTDSPPAAGHVWGMNLVRVVPGVGVSSWGGPSDVAPRPASMGLMKFAR